MGILADIVGNLLKPATEGIGSEIADSLRSRHNQPRTELAVEVELQLRTYDWEQHWGEFISWQKQYEERPHILRATDAFSEFEPTRIRDLVLDGHLKTTGEEDRTEKLNEFGLAKQDFGVALLLFTIPLGLLFALSWFGGFAIAIFVDGDLALSSFFLGLVIYGVLTVINKVWSYSIRLTPIGRAFVNAELLPALSLFLDEQRN